MQLLLERAAEKFLIIFALNPIWRTTGLGGAEEGILQGNKETRPGGKQLGHSFRDLFSKNWVKSNEKLIRKKKKNVRYSLGYLYLEGKLCSNEVNKKEKQKGSCAVTDRVIIDEVKASFGVNVESFNPIILKKVTGEKVDGPFWGEIGLIYLVVNPDLSLNNGSARDVDAYNIITMLS